MFGKSHPKKTKMNIAKGEGTLYETQGTLVNNFSSTRGAAVFLKFSHVTIAKYVKNKK